MCLVWHFWRHVNYRDYRQKLTQLPSEKTHDALRDDGVLVCIHIVRDMRYVSMIKCQVVVS